RESEIRPCIECNHCIDMLRPGRVGGQATECTVNPAAVRERESAIVRATRAKRVLVIGGGPAGLEGAAIAAARGHDVTLWEKDMRLGGQLYYAAIPPFKETLKPLLHYLVAQAHRLGVKVELGRIATLESIRRLGPEAIIMATGATPTVPNIPGIASSKVIGALRVLEGDVEVGARVAVIGGELVGCEVAEFLVNRKRSVTVLRRGMQMAARMESSRRDGMLDRLTYKGVRLLPGVTYKEITADGIEIKLPDGSSETILADSIVLAAGARPNNELHSALSREVSTYLAGDVVEPRGIRDAVHEGAAVGRDI
ncbi:MAG: FAD-dependent oxidoreductase, partial [Chloroflexi bacterium]|nr:FAD-dependent oxidoreductase [Chloroflexota bacterium]